MFPHRFSNDDILSAAQSRMTQTKKKKSETIILYKQLTKTKKNGILFLGFVFLFLLVFYFFFIDFSLEKENKTGLAWVAYCLMVLSIRRVHNSQLIAH